MPERLRGRAYGWAALAGLAALIIALRGASLLYSHSLNSIDGAMQTWFALDHFARGDQLGSAFQSYLGVTMVLALVPVFMAFGETLFASTLAANAMVVAGCFAGCCAVMWLIRPIPPRARWQVAVLLAFGFYYAAPFAFEGVGLPYPATFDPGVSLRPLRGALPFFVLPVFVWALRRVLRGGHALVGGGVLGLVAGAGLLWSNDVGIPLVLAAVLGLVAALFRRPALLMRTLTAFALGVVGSASAILLAVTHGAPGPWLQYNFRDVAGDQFWFFAPWERSTRILGLADLPNIIRHGELLSSASLIVLVVCVVWIILRRLRGRGEPVRQSAFIFVGASVIGTALLPQIGGHIGAEYNAITFVLGASAPLILFQRPMLRWGRPLWQRLRLMPLVALAGLGMIGIEAAHFAQVRAETDRTVLDPALGFYVTPRYAEDLAAMRQLAAAWEAEGIPADRRLLSVYTSSLDVAAGTTSPASVGSLIHALGPSNRAAFTALVSEGRVAAVTTIAPDFSGWEGWITRANWPFFRALRDMYHPIARNGQQVLWAAGGGKFRTSEATCDVVHVTGDRTEITITAQAAGLASIRLERSGSYATGRAAMLTVTEDSPFTRRAAEPAWSDFPRYGVPNADLVEVSAEVEPGSPTRLTLQTLGGAFIGSAQCRARVYEPIDFAALPGLAAGVDAYLTRLRR
ncbi:MAG TPA: hypothetical protein VLA50_09320 [Erythrobacter sp.]|nr:hypothetical protein [Erythrobacter sp.]